MIWKVCHQATEYEVFGGGVEWWADDDQNELRDKEVDVLYVVD